MGVDYNVYVGPFLEVHNPPRQDKEERNCCSNPHCSKHKRETGDKFCSECGREIGTVSVAVEKPLWFNSYEETDERIAPACHHYGGFSGDKKDYNFFIPNLLGYGRHFDAESMELLEITPETITDQTQRFTNDFAADFRKMADFFGSDSMKIKWGVMLYAS